MIELVRKPTQAELLILGPFTEASARARQQANEADAQLAMVAAHLEPDADFDPNIMAFVRHCEDAAETKESE